MMNLVVWSWVIPYFGLTGAFLAKFNRYMSPLLPFALLWAAWLIVVLWRGRGAAKDARCGCCGPRGAASRPDRFHLADSRFDRFVRSGLIGAG